MKRKKEKKKRKKKEEMKERRKARQVENLKGKPRQKLGHLEKK